MQRTSGVRLMELVRWASYLSPTPTWKFSSMRSIHRACTDTIQCDIASSIFGQSASSSVHFVQIYEGCTEFLQSEIKEPARRAPPSPNTHTPNDLVSVR